MEHSVAPSSPQNTLTRKIFLKIYIKHTQSSHVRRVLAQYFLHSIPFLWSKSIRNTSWGCNFKQRYFKITRGGRVRLSTSHPSKRATVRFSWVGFCLENKPFSASGKVRQSLPRGASAIFAHHFFFPTPHSIFLARSEKVEAVLVWDAHVMGVGRSFGEHERRISSVYSSVLKCTFYRNKRKRSNRNAPQVCALFIWNLLKDVKNWYGEQLLNLYSTSMHSLMHPATKIFQ